MKSDKNTLASRRYQNGYDYNLRIDYYGEVSENIDYLAGKQWGNDVSRSSMPNPVFNIEKMVEHYQVATVISPSIAAKYSVEGVDEDVLEGENKILSEMAKLMSNSATVRWERQKMMSVLRKCVEDAWVSGDMCCHVYWDHSKKTNQNYKGDFCTERLSGGNVFFGDANTPDVEKQPYILVVKRETVLSVRNRAKSYGMSKDDIEKIMPDSETRSQLGQLYDTEMQGNETLDQKLNVYLTYYKEDDVVYLDESTETVDMQIKKKVKNGRYPIAWGNWQTQENSYHGRPQSSEIHTTQRFINKMFSLCMLWMINNAFGKVVFDETRCNGVTNEIGVAIPVTGSVSEVIYQLKSGDFNSAIMTVIDKAIEYTLQFCGVSSSALGQSAAYNTSAIVTNVKQSAVQLEGNQARVFQFVEDIYEIWADFIIEKYGDGRLMPIEEDGKIVYKPFDATMRSKMIMNTKIDVGASSVWSEQAAQQTLDNMLLNQIITPIQYLERLENGVIRDKSKLIEELKAIANMPEEQPPTPMTDNVDMEAMAQFFDTLPQEQQIALKSMQPDQMQQALIQLMNTPVMPEVQAGGQAVEQADLDGF